MSQAQLEFIRRLGADWQDLAVSLGIPPDTRFDWGPLPNKGSLIWDWLFNRDRLKELPEALRQSGREELAALLESVKQQVTTAKPQNLPFHSIKSLFKGRDADLATLRDQLQAHPEQAVGLLGTQLLHGLGGIGKTRLAVEYGWRHQSAYTALLFVQADSPESLHRNLAELAGPRILSLKAVQEAPEEEIRVAEVLKWLKTNPGWLLIVDNVDSPEAAEAVENLLKDARPDDSPDHGHVLITSRLKNWGPGVNSVELNVLSAAASADFLRERTAGSRQTVDTDEDDLKELVSCLDGLALALEQAGSYIRTTRCTFREYLTDWQSQQAEVLEWFAPRLSKYPAGLAVTWQTSWKRLQPASRRLLEVLSWLAPDPIPEFLLTHADAEETRQTILQGSSLRLTLADLEQYSFLRRNVNQKPAAVQVHRLVQEITRRRIQDGERCSCLRHCLDLVNSSAPGEPQNVLSWEFWVPLASHVRAVCSYADALQIVSPTTSLMNELAEFYLTKALYTEAEPLVRRALAISEHNYGSEHPTITTHLNTLASILKDTSRLSEAEDLMRRALVIDEEMYGSNSLNVARDLNNLSALLIKTNQMIEAEHLVRRALAISEQSYGPNHSNVARDLSNLAGLLRATNRLNEAELHYRRALAIDEQNYGPNHPDIAIHLNNMAGLLRATDRLSEAEPLYRRALAIDEQIYGPDHPEVAADLNNLAFLLNSTARSSEAETLLCRALAILRRVPHQAAYPHTIINHLLANYFLVLSTLYDDDWTIIQKFVEAGVEPEWLKGGDGS